MVDQTQVKPHDGKTSSPARAVAHNMSGVAHDAVTLGELQLQLLQVDLQDSLRRLIAPLALLTLGAIVLLACLPVALMALAYWLVQAFDFSEAAAFGIAALTALVLSLILAGIGYLLLRRSTIDFSRTKTELSHNLQWIKQALRGGSKPATPPVY